MEDNIHYSCRVKNFFSLEVCIMLYYLTEQRYPDWESYKADACEVYQILIGEFSKQQRIYVSTEIAQAHNEIGGLSVSG